MDITYIEGDLPTVVKELVKNTPNKVLCFYGEMGAGKTTLIKALLKELGGIDVVNSPTFGIANEYLNGNEEVLAYHFDFYRLNDEMEALDLGFEDYLQTQAWILIEWPEKIASLLPEDATAITIEVLSPTERRLFF